MPNFENGLAPFSVLTWSGRRGVVKPDPAPGGRDSLGEHAMRRAVQSAPAHHQPTPPSAQVKVPPSTGSPPLAGRRRRWSSSR